MRLTPIAIDVKPKYVKVSALIDGMIVRKKYYKHSEKKARKMFVQTYLRPKLSIPSISEVEQR